MTLKPTETRAWKKLLAAYQTPSHARSAFEIVITAAPLVALWALACWAVTRELWWGIALIAPAAFFLVRLFMIQHDCGHGAFFRWKALNDWVGRSIGVLTLTPYDYWRTTHAIHHATSGNLDRRGLGAIETMTVAEYQALPWIKRLGYRLYRHPIVLFVIGPAFVFLIMQRLPVGLMKNGWRPWLSVMGTNLAVLALAVALVLLGGIRPLLFVHIPIMLVGAGIGVWLFYIQHQFEGVKWSRQKDWSLTTSALEGSSHYVMPQPLRWFSANIGIHHVHHVSSRIPYYHLPKVLQDHPELEEVNRVTLWQSLKAIPLALWDEAGERMVTFRQAKAMARVPA